MSSPVTGISRHPFQMSLAQRRDRLPHTHAIQQVDRVTFSGKTQSQVKTEAQKIAELEQEAYTLFSKNKTKESLIKAVQESFKSSPYKLEIFDASAKGQEWVEQVCDAYGNAAFFHVPDSLAYDLDPKKPIVFSDEPLPEPVWYTPKGLMNTVILKPLQWLDKMVFQNTGSQAPEFPEYYVKTILPELYKKQKLAVFVRKDTDMAVLMHELNHVLQFKHGLRHATTQEADTTARNYINGYNQFIFPPLTFSLFGKQLSLGHGIDSAWQLGKRMFSWAFEVPYSQIKRLLKKETPSNSVGEAIRVNMELEKQNELFLWRKGADFGLSFKQRLEQLSAYLQETLLKSLISYNSD